MENDMSKSKIEWTEATWNPVTGCAKVSAGCKNCYAEREWIRLSANPQTIYFQRNFNDVMCHHERLEQPIRWLKPRRIFVNSMSDLFHEDVPDEFIDKIFEIIRACPQHTFQILTKRTKRMKRYMINQLKYKPELKNLWLGISVENQATFDERISDLLAISKAAVNWVSVEPLLGMIDFGFPKEIMKHDSGLHWVVVGGESGHKARPMHPAWVRSIRDQSKEAGVPFLFKQWGEWAIDQLHAGGDLGGDLKRGIVQHLCLDRENDGHFRKGDVHMRRVGKRTAGRLLDSILHDEYPEVYQND